MYRPRYGDSDNKEPTWIVYLDVFPCSELGLVSITDLPRKRFQSHVYLFVIYNHCVVYVDFSRRRVFGKSIILIN